MKNNKNKPKKYVKNNQTEAWADIEKELPISKVPIPSDDSVKIAKHWVDNVQK